MLFKEDKVAREEVKAVRTNVGWYRWTHDMVEVTGKDSGKVLDYLCVNNIGSLKPGESKYTTILNDAGKIEDDVIVTCIEENLYWVSTLYGPKFQPWLEKNKGSMDVSYKDLTGEIDMYAVQGPNSMSYLNAILEKPIDDLKKFHIEDNKIGDVKVKILRAGFTGEKGYEIYCDMENSSKIRDALVENDKKYKGMELRILEVYVRSIPMEKGFALRQDMYGLTPYEAGLGWSVYLDKEFIGKEELINAKSEYKLVGVELDPERESYEDIAQNEPVFFKGVQCGIIRQMIYGYTVDKNIGFAIVNIENSEPGTQLTTGPNFAKITVCDKNFLGGI